MLILAARDIHMQESFTQARTGPTMVPLPDRSYRTALYTGERGFVCFIKTLFSKYCQILLLHRFLAWNYNKKKITQLTKIGKFKKKLIKIRNILIYISKLSLQRKITLY